MSSFIVIRGPLGSGKSTLSKELARRLSATVISIDDVLDDNGLDTKPPDAPCIPAENLIKANEIVLPRVNTLLATGKIVIFDGCFYHNEVIEHLVQHLPYEDYIFTLKIPVELCIERDSKRNKCYGEDAARAVHSLVSQFDYGTTIDASGSIEDTLQHIISLLPLPDVKVKKSSIHGTGVFAARNFKKGEVVVPWNYVKKLPEREIADLPEEELHYLMRLDDDTFAVVGSPARYVNHSCDANTVTRDGADVAARDIAEGEEITADYRTEECQVGFRCSCGTEHCVKCIGNI